MKEKVNIKGIVIEILITSILTFVVQCILLMFNFDSGKVEIIQSLNNDGEYNVFIGIRNFELNEYIENIFIEVTQNVELSDISISTKNIQYTENMFEIKQISPKTTESIHFVSKNEITNSNLKIVKNGAKLRIENLNDENAIDGNIIILILMYTLISAIFSFISNFRSEKKEIEREDIRKEARKVIDRKIKVLEEEVEYDRNTLEKQKEVLSYTYVEIKDLIKENDFYRKLIQNILIDSEKTSSKKIQKKITEELKTYTTEDGFAKNYEKLKFVSNKLHELESKELK